MIRLRQVRYFSERVSLKDRRFLGIRYVFSICMMERPYLIVACYNDSGPDAKKLLQGLCTNDLTQLRKKGDCLAVSFLTSKGRIFSNGFVYQLPSENLHDVLIDVDVKMHSELKKYLAVYKLRAKASIRTLSYHAYLDVNRFDEKYQCSDSGIVVESVDPRVPNYGVRVIRDNVDNSCDSLNDEWLVTRDCYGG